MSRYVYLNKRTMPLDQASISPFDRSFLFGDGVYEALAVYRDNIIDLDPHLQRLSVSLAQVNMTLPISQNVLRQQITHLCAINRVRNGSIYIQVSRGISFPRQHDTVDSEPQLFITATNVRPLHGHRDYLKDLSSFAVSAKMMGDQRWQRCDIKSINLLPNVMAKFYAKDHDFGDVIFFNNAGDVTESASGNVWVLGKDNILYTPPLTQNILSGVTRRCLLTLCEKINITVRQSAISNKMITDAREVFISSAIRFVTPVRSLCNADNVMVTFDKTPGDVSQQLYKAYRDRADQQCLASQQSQHTSDPSPSGFSINQYAKVLQSA